MARTHNILDDATFANIYTDEKFRNQVAFAHWYANSAGQKQYRITSSYPITWIVTDDQVAEAEAERQRAKQKAIANGKGKLVFVGMGMPYEPKCDDDVCNYRIWAKIQNPDGRRFFIEVMQGRGDTIHVDFSIDRDEQSRLEKKHGIYAPQSYYNFGNIERRSNGASYTLQNVLQLVNKTYNCHFREIVIDNYNLTPDDIVSVSPSIS